MCHAELKTTVSPPTRDAHTAPRKTGRPDTLTHSKTKAERASGAFSMPSDQVPKRAAANGQGTRWRLLQGKQRALRGQILMKMEASASSAISTEEKEPPTAWQRTVATLVRQLQADGDHLCG